MTRMTNEELYRRHLKTLDQVLCDSLERAARKGLQLDGVLFHAGPEGTYHRDDELISFRADAHYRRYVPLIGPDHCVLARPGRMPLVVRVAPKDYWYEIAPPAPSYWQGEVELREVSSFAEVGAAVGPLNKIAYVGPSPEAAAALGIPAELVEPAALMNPLDWHRAVKTEHEIALMDVAAERAGRGHRAAREAFEAGEDERGVHWAYLRGTGHLECEMPFETIAAIDEKSATLHYQNKRTDIPTPHRSFLMDAGATCDGYASDITRTWANPADGDPLYLQLLHGVDLFQRELVEMVVPGRPFMELHVAAHLKVAELLCRLGVLKGAPQKAYELGLTRPFLPHGLGHHLGLQVHDVGGQMANPEGELAPPPPEFPALRNTRRLEVGHVVTIEPGLYFIPLLLDPIKAGPNSQFVDWKLVEHFLPFGGVRIEDDVVCTADGPRDLTRPYIEGPRGV